MKLYELLYREGKLSTVTHDGKVYSVDKLLKDAESLEEEAFEVAELEWILEGIFLDEDRVENADLKYPLLITRWENKFVILDGVHRLAKAIQEERTEVMGKVITQKMLKSAKLF